MLVYIWKLVVVVWREVRYIRVEKLVLALLQTSFSLYLYNQWTDFHKLSGKPQIRAIHIYAGCTKVITSNQDIKSSVTIKTLFANIS